MAPEAWLPVGYVLPDQANCRLVLYEGAGWQILETQGGGRALLVCDTLFSRWVQLRLLESGSMAVVDFGDKRYWELSCGPSQVLCPVSDGKSPNSKTEALAFSLALKATRALDAHSPLQDALYVEKLSRLLPTFSITVHTDDDVVLGYWLTGGASVSVKSFRRLRQMLSWLAPTHLKEVVEAAGFEVKDIPPADTQRRGAAEVLVASVPRADDSDRLRSDTLPGTFELPGRPKLSAFINEHIIDIVRNSDRYASLGIDFPSAVVLHGPPGCGKTYAVERLVDFLGWPSFQIDASSVASPYIHETSRKVSDVFEKAMKSAPAILVIDEMEAFLADREMGSGQHRVEEVAEFLRRIPEAAKNHVLIVAMTNRIEMIDPAILRRGRFDHVIKVDYATEEEVRALLQKLLSSLPAETGVDPAPLARGLAGRPLSDVSFVVREGARLAARSGKDKLDQQFLLAALTSAPARTQEDEAKRRIGFVW